MGCDLDQKQADPEVQYARMIVSKHPELIVARIPSKVVSVIDAATLARFDGRRKRDQGYYHQAYVAVGLRVYDVTSKFHVL